MLDFLRTSSVACASYSSSRRGQRPTVKSVGVQVFSGFLSVIVVQQVCRDLIVGRTYSTQNELAFLSSLCAVKRRAGICRPMQVTVRIRVSAALDEQDGKVTRDSDVLAIFGVSLAQACRTGRGDVWCLGPRERRGRGIELSLFRLRLRTRNNPRQGQCGRAKSIGGLKPSP